jgi:hypothetical protein
MTGADGYAAVAHDTEPTEDTTTTLTPTTITAIIRASTDSAITTIIVSATGITTDTIECRQDAGSIKGAPASWRDVMSGKMQHVREPPIVARKLNGVDGRDRDEK